VKDFSSPSLTWREKIMKLFSSLAVLGLFATAALGFAADEKKDELKCPVSGKPALKEKAVDFNGGKVYFCCENCPKAFEKDSAKYAEKANAQLILSGQATQTKCPLSGGKINPEKTATVSGVEVKFCCEKCQGKVQAAKGDEQAKLVFSNENFKKGWEVKAAK
jgi:YHS domain-containing protein